CLTKLGGKRAEQVQKFVPRNRIRIFRNERARSTPLDAKMTFFSAFGTIWVHSGLFGCLTKLGAKRAELVQKFVPQSHVEIFRNERARSTTFDLKLTFWCVSYNLGAFGLVRLPYKTRCKMGRTSAKVCARSRVGIFRNESTRSTPLDPKLMFWLISYYLSAFGIIWL